MPQRMFFPHHEEHILRNPGRRRKLEVSALGKSSCILHLLPPLAPPPSSPSSTPPSLAPPLPPLAPPPPSPSSTCTPAPLVRCCQGPSALLSGGASLPAGSGRGSGSCFHDSVQSLLLSLGPAPFHLETLPLSLTTASSGSGTLQLAPSVLPCPSLAAYFYLPSGSLCPGEMMP